jgi:hypothetical protein
MSEQEQTPRETPQWVLNQWLTLSDRYPHPAPSHIREAIRAVLATAEKPLDVTRTTSCGHTWTMRHTACPTCFGEIKAERDALCQKAEAALRGCRSQSLGLERDRDWLLRSLGQHKNGSGNPCAGILASRAALRDTAPVEEKQRERDLQVLSDASEDLAEMNRWEP